VFWRDQAGSPSKRFENVTSRTPLPFAFITNTSESW
jgi:hypothetical protein